MLYQRVCKIMEIERSESEKKDKKLIIPFEFFSHITKKIHELFDRKELVHKSEKLSDV